MHKKQERQCANCFVCLKHTELCPLNENYQELSVEDWLIKINETKKNGVINPVLQAGSILSLL